MTAAHPRDGMEASDTHWQELIRQAADANELEEEIYLLRTQLTVATECVRAMRRMLKVMGVAIEHENLLGPISVTWCQELIKTIDARGARLEAIL
jgi:hypothetical protein